MARREYRNQLRRAKKSTAVTTPSRSSRASAPRKSSATRCASKLPLLYMKSSVKVLHLAKLPAKKIGLCSDSARGNTELQTQELTRRLEMPLAARFATAASNPP